MMEIRKLCDRLEEHRLFGDERRFVVLGLHSSLDSNAQRAIFRKYPPGIVKIVVSTNIAETSITIDEITHVVDTGRVKEMQYNAEKRMAHLCETWCSQASSKQRRGRAGRTKEGVCYKLFSRQLHEQVMQPYQLPEIKRVPLEDLTLQIMLNGSQPVGFLRKAMDPPDAEAVRAAIDNLLELGAIAISGSGSADTLQCELTPLGFHLAHIPVEPRIGKMLIFGCIFGVLPPLLTVAAACKFTSNPPACDSWAYFDRLLVIPGAGKSPFNAPMGKQADADSKPPSQPAVACQVWTFF
jgi:ATP-dependent RNA helicase DHX36